VGGIGLVIGPAGLILAKVRCNEDLTDVKSKQMEISFTCMLLLVGLTGMLLLILRSTPAMGALLALHLGFVFGFFVTMPYSKFVHGLYRFGALVRYAQERRALEDRRRPAAR
jgi:citrate/tricarballylate utilization protein